MKKPSSINTSFDNSHDALAALKTELGSIVSSHQSGAFMYISIDNMASLVSSQGADSADKLIDTLADDIARISEDTHHTFRVQRDAIGLIVENIKKDALGDKAQEIFNYVQQYGCTCTSIPMQLIGTLGVAFISPEMKSKDVDGIYNDAYIANNDAKEHCVHYEVYVDSQKHKVHSRNQMVLANYIQNAFLNNRLTLAYQPIVSAKTQECDYYECLLRIINDDGTLSTAGPFIPIAEKMGFIEVIDGMVLEMAVKELSKNPELRLSINVSSVTIHSSDWLSLAVHLLDGAGCANRLVVEITETAEIKDIRKTAAFVQTLQAMGCRVALDDFGAGYTSFSQLKELSLDIIKIDGQFVRNIAETQENHVFVKALLQFANNFNLVTVAEFVENKDIASVLTKMGVDYMQGNYFAAASENRDWKDSA